jgi:Transposase DDE domain/Domain of unknown function (DUF4372)
MKTNKNQQPSQRNLTVLRQLVELIPAHLVPKLARETGTEDQARTFSPWSHVVAMIYAQVSHALGLNDVCDALRLRVGALHAMRGATPPARNTLSHANKTRDCALAEKLFWKVLTHLQTLQPRFGGGGRKTPAWRFRRSIQVVDATTIQLVANCISWAKHRRRKAAAKCHLRMDLQSFLPRFAIVDVAREHDSQRAAEVCAGLREGEIVLFDKAYLHFRHLWALTERGVFWVTRAKDNLDVRVQQRLPAHADPRLLRDDLVLLRGPLSKEKYPGVLRRVTAKMTVDGQERVMVFLTNNLDWSPLTVCDLYRCRWQIEVFFKQLKQTVQLVDFLGNTANAVKWQVWTALLVHLLLRFLAWRSQWGHSFTRLFTFVRAALWLPRDLAALLKSCGTADGSFRCLGRPEQAWLPGLAPALMG